MADRPIDHLAWRMDRLETSSIKDQEAVDALERTVSEARALIRDQQHEIRNLRQMAETAAAKADAAAKALDIKEREAAAEARARTMVARWMQIGLGAIVIIATIWSGKMMVAIEQIRALVGK